MKKWILVLATALATFTGAASASDQPGGRVTTTVITVPPRAVPDIARTVYQDSTLNGGPNFTFPRVVVTLPDYCTSHPTDPACLPAEDPVVPPEVDPCILNPTAPGCDGGGITNPPPPATGTCGQTCPTGGWYDENGVCVKTMPMCEGGGGGPRIGHCGMPENWGYNADPNCIQISGGWKCNERGITTYYVCP